MKQVIFNAGGALASYTEFDNKTLLIDIGKSSDFNPILDFLLPLCKERGSDKSTQNSNKYHIDQIVISHPHKDHISAIEDFDKHFYPELLTVPNDNLGMPNGHTINWDLIGNKEDNSIIKLKEMLVRRQPPLRTTSDQNEFIYYLPPQSVVEVDTELTTESYCNNISIIVFLIINQHRVIFAGDLQKKGMDKILEREHYLKNKLKGGVDVLIAPHHGLKSSFSTTLFDNMKDKKTRCLNIISEKPNNPAENRDVDTRYSSTDYCKGENNLEGGNGVEKCCQVKTSRGHIFIDYSKKGNPEFEIITDNDTLLDRFL